MIRLSEGAVVVDDAFTTLEEEDEDDADVS